jgi:NAD(P)-dependent dehydrogenase (short-subunit alcohol dehydrogenase family)
VSTVLITGAGRGIGRSIALRLAQHGWHVLAGVRRDEDGARLAAEATAGAIAPVRLDVTNADDITALSGALPERVDAIVNNAGVVVDGPIEAVSLDDLRRQFEINVVGQVAVTQAALPRLRESRGRIVFMSSVSGRVSTPWTGAYNASKFAIEGLADSLRLELRPWGIKVILVEPTSTDTDMWREALEQLDRTVAGMDAEHRGLYRKHIVGMRRATKLIQKGTVSPEKVVDVVEKALTAKRPKARYPVGILSKAQLAGAALAPTPVLDVSLARATGVPRKP